MIEPLHEKRVVVAMSGGVDSSVAAALLVEQGYEVIGLMARLWTEQPVHGQEESENRCCAPQAVVDARRVAELLDIPFYVLNLQSEFKSCVVDRFVYECSHGRTPNPCVVCNRQVRFGRLWHHAAAIGARYLATGHYARIDRVASCFRLCRGVDRQKDQSYMLYTLSDDELGRILFPLGTLTKAQVREAARERHLPVADRSESMDLCFVRDGSHRRFLREHAPDTDCPGPILDAKGREIGRHKGLAFYTVGQRRGIGLSSAAPLYVLHLDPVRNAVVVGPADDLSRRSLRVTDVHYVAGRDALQPVRVMVQVRYRAKPASARWTDTGSQTALVDLDEPVRGIAPGQSAVAYQGDVVYGGGIIAE